MAEKEPLGWRVDSAVRERFRDHVADEDGNTHGRLGEALEDAMREYMDETRDARLENKIDDIRAMLSENDDTHTHDTCTPQSPTAEKVADIVERIESDIDTNREIYTVQDDDVVRAIEEVAGADDRTVSKYRTQIKRRGELYQHPISRVWMSQAEAWAVQWAYGHIESTPGASPEDVLEEYPMTHDEFIEILERNEVFDEQEVET